MEEQRIQPLSARDLVKRMAALATKEGREAEFKQAQYQALQQMACETFGFALAMEANRLAMLAFGLRESESDEEKVSIRWSEFQALALSAAIFQTAATQWGALTFEELIVEAVACREAIENAGAAHMSPGRPSGDTSKMMVAVKAALDGMRMGMEEATGIALPGTEIVPQPFAAFERDKPLD